MRPESRRLLLVFAAALAARLAFLFLADQPLLYTHQYTYFTNGLRIAEHPEPWRYVLWSDEWRTWNVHWTIAPLYHVFLGAVFGLFGSGLLVLRLIQCVLDAGAAVAVAVLGRQAAGPRGAWAGLAYAVYWPALEMPTWTMTENLHTPLFTAALTILASEVGRQGGRTAFVGGFVLGLSALARSVSSGFAGVAALWRLFATGRPLAWRPALLLAAGAALAILPWTARNVFLVGDAVLIESAAFENIWWANHLTDRARYARQEEVIQDQPTPAAKRATALHFALRGIRRNPGGFLEKVRSNFWHFLRPEGLQNLVRVERSLEPWRHAGSLLLDDLPMLAALPFFVVFLAAGRPTAARSLIALWTAYYLFMVVVLFHNEIRYRSALMPFVFAGVPGGFLALRGPDRRRRARVALVAGLVVAAAVLQPYVLPSGRALAAAWRMRDAVSAASRGDLAESQRIAESAAARDPQSPRPWLDLGQSLLRQGRAVESITAYRRGAALSNFANWRPVLGLFVGLRALGDPEAAELQKKADGLSWNTDPWLLLEVAWMELPPPRMDEVRLGDGDYGAVRGFLHPRGLDPALSAHRREWTFYGPEDDPRPPRGTHRWTRHRAWIRLVPTQPASAYDVTIEMGAPFPSTLRAPEVKVRIGGGDSQRVVLNDEVRRYTFPATSRPGAPIVVRIDSPTWCRLGEPADQGVRVDRVAVAPARAAADALRVGGNVLYKGRSAVAR